MNNKISNTAIRNHRVLYRLVICLILILIQNNDLRAQDEDMTLRETGNVSAKGFVVNETELKLRWSPVNIGAWVDGQKYGYTVERYTMNVDNKWLENPKKEVLSQSIKPKPIQEWQEIAEKSDYAAVIAQAFYGEDFNLGASPKDIGSIINQAEELQQRFSTSVFMAEYDYDAAKMAGWAFTDNTIKKNEKYLYRIILDRPEKLEGDTAAVFISYVDKEDLPKPLDLTALFGDKSAILSWNYALLSDIYHSYHIEKANQKDGVFHRITELPFTSLNSEMQEIFYTDSLANNETNYIYRVLGVTSFGEVGPASDTINGHGQKTVKCVPQIYAGDFVEDDKAHIYWKFECEEEDLVQNFRIERCTLIDGDYEVVLDDIPVHLRELSFKLDENQSYIQLSAINKDGTHQTSYPFLLREVDSIPPSIPIGLKATVDSLGVAHISWDPNMEDDLRGYRILRSFDKDGEKSSLISDFITDTNYSDSLSLSLSNSKVYYSLTAVDMRYNESEPCVQIEVEKPNFITPADPVITGYITGDNDVTISWITDTRRKDITYILTRKKEGADEEEIIVFAGDATVNSFIDQVPETGDYIYKVTAEALNGKKSISPQLLNLHLSVNDDLNQVSGFNSYIDANEGYIELSWRKHPKATKYRIYKLEDDKKMFLWEEVDATTNRIIDEQVSVDTKYTYTILYISEEGRPSKTKNIVVNY